MDKNLLVRISSAIIFTTVLFLIYYFYNKNGLISLSLLILLLGSNEYGRMIFPKNKPILYFFNSLCFLSLTCFYLFSMSPFVYMALPLITAYVLIINRNSKDTDAQLKTISLLFLGYFYTSVLPFFVIKLLSIENNGLLLFASVLAITFANDIFAYFCGRAFGNKKILPNISPKKTIAGSIGGLIASSLVALYFLSYLIKVSDPVSALVIGLLCSTAGQSGDFFASLLKRTAKVKDSGSLMPGHGGVLDRLDGVYFVAPVFYGLYYLFLA